MNSIKSWWEPSKWNINSNSEMWITYEKRDQFGQRWKVVPYLSPNPKYYVGQQLPVINIVMRTKNKDALILVALKERDKKNENTEALVYGAPIAGL